MIYSISVKLFSDMYTLLLWKWKCHDNFVKKNPYLNTVASPNMWSDCHIKNIGKFFAWHEWINCNLDSSPPGFNICNIHSLLFKTYCMFSVYNDLYNKWTYMFYTYFWGLYLCVILFHKVKEQLSHYNKWKQIYLKK